MTEEELRHYAHYFFEENGIPLSDSRSLTVKVDVMPRRMDRMGDAKVFKTGVYSSGYYPFPKLHTTQRGIVRIYVFNTFSKLQFLRVLFHELDHVLWRWEGKRFKRFMPYYKMPHERRAFHVGDFWARRVIDMEVAIMSAEKDIETSNENPSNPSREKLDTLLGTVERCAEACASGTLWPGWTPHLEDICSFVEDNK